MAGSLAAMVAAAIETGQTLISPIAGGSMAAALIFGGVVFIVAIIKAFTKQTTGWIITAVVSAVVALIGLFGSISLAAKAVTKLAKEKKEEGERRKRVASADGKFRLEVPGNWKEMPGLNEAASISAGNEFKEQYVMVIENPKTDFEGTLAEFEDAVSGMVIGNLEKAESGDPEKASIGKFPAIRRRFTGVADNIRVVYHSAAVETKTGFYQILTWTTPSRESAAKAVFEEVINSFTSDDGPPGPGDDSPQSKGDIEGRIRLIVVDQLGLKPEQVTPEARFIEDLGADSLDTVELVMATEEEFEISIADEDAEKIRTIGDLVRYVEAKTKAPAEAEEE